MKREYTIGTAENITFFTGIEIEKTPAHNMQTLFVVGVHEPSVILKYCTNHPSNITHIYFGANQSFSPVSHEDWSLWTDMIFVLLEEGYWCTLDFDSKHIEILLEYCLTEKRRFIPQISVKIPYLTLLGYNATLKLDDKDFDATNPGVWCHKLSNLTTDESFTGWDAYGKDEILK